MTHDAAVSGEGSEESRGSETTPPSCFLCDSDALIKQNVGGAKQKHAGFQTTNMSQFIFHPNEKTLNEPATENQQENVCFYEKIGLIQNIYQLI